jgi:hypothetical protein
MFVRVFDGLYAGEIRDFPSHIAHELIANGRAENPYAEPEPQAVFAAAARPLGVESQNRVIDKEMASARSRRKPR